MKIAIISESSKHLLAFRLATRAGMHTVSWLSDGQIYVRVEGLSEESIKTLLYPLDYVVSTLDE